MSDFGLVPPAGFVPEEHVAAVTGARRVGRSVSSQPEGAKLRLDRSKLEALHKRYSGEFERSKRWRQVEGYDDLWRRMVDLYRGKHYRGLSESDRLVVNMAFATKNVIAPAIAIGNPKFLVFARRPESEPQAILAEEVLNYLWRSNNYHKEFRLAVDDFLIVGHGWLKVGYKFVREEVRRDPDPVPEGVDDRDPDAPANVESEMVVVEDRPFVERVPFFDMFVDPDARSEKDVRWVAQRVRRPLEDVKADKRYVAEVRKNVQASAVDKWSDSRGFRGSDSEGGPSYVDVIEFYDLRRNIMCVFPEKGEGFLIRPRKIPFSFGSPFVMLRNHEVPDHFYPMGDLEAIETLQLELNETRTQMLNHRKKFARKWLYSESAFDDRGIAALESDEDNVMVPVLGGENISNVVVPMPAAITPPEFYNQSQLITNDINMVSAVSDYMRGQMSTIRRTATEAAMLQDAQNARAQDKLTRIETFLAQIGRRLLQLSQQFMTGDQVLRVAGPMGYAWVVYDADYIAGEFDFEVEAGSTMPRNESFRRQAALQLVDAMAPFAAAGVVNMAALAAHVLREGFGIKAPESFMQAPQVAQPSPMPAEVPPPVPAPAPEEQGLDRELFSDVASAQAQVDLPPELLAQLESQVGLDLPFS